MKCEKCKEETKIMKEALSRALRALCLTKDYVGDVLKPIEGWEWYDAGKAIAAIIPNDEWAIQFNMRIKIKKDTTDGN